MLDWTAIGRSTNSEPMLERGSSGADGFAEVMLRVRPGEFLQRANLERPVRATLIILYTLVARPQWSYEKEGFLVVE